MTIESRLKLGFALAVLLMGLTAVVPFYTAHWAHSLQQELRESQNRVEVLGGLRDALQDAETGQRGFVLTGRENFLEPYHAGMSRLRQMRPELPQALAPMPGSMPVLSRLDELIELRLKELALTMDLRRSQGLQAAADRIAEGRGKVYMDEIRGLIARLVDEENQHRTALRSELDRRTDVDAYAGLMATLLDVMLLGVVAYFLLRVMRERHLAHEKLARTSEELNEGLAALAQRNAEITLVGEMARALESPASMDESFETISVFCAKLLAGTSGILYLFRNSRDLLERESHWGAPLAAVDMLAPQDCWAIRRGQAHVSTGHADLVCRHYRNAGLIVPGALCLPLTSQGEVLGLMCVQPAPEQSAIEPRQHALAQTLSEQIALTVSNVSLREQLRQQSVIDPLTGLFNRRYMDETLKREISRARRRAGALSLIVLDVDHFKRINDLHGHDAGDAALSALAQYLKGEVRESDVACRYGGEEFVLILPDCAKQNASQRAERMKSQIRALEVRRGGQPLGRITASFGIASFPEDGQDIDSLFQAADRAMYVAKSTGRDRVVVAAKV